MPDSIIDTGEKRINEAVCIDTKRIYDSCVSKDCLEDLRVTFLCPGANAGRQRGHRQVPGLHH